MTPMAMRIAIIQGHPDPGGGHFGHALADAYARTATQGGRNRCECRVHGSEPTMHPAAIKHAERRSPGPICCLPIGDAAGLDVLRGVEARHPDLDRAILYCRPIDRMAPKQRELTGRIM